MEEFWVFTGIGEIFLKAESYEDKEQWLKLLAKEKNLIEQNKKLEQGIFFLKNSNLDFEWASLALDNLMPQSNMEQIKVFMGNIWHTFAKMREWLDEIEAYANYKQQQSIKKLNSMQNDLKNQIEILCQKFSREYEIISKISTVVKQKTNLSFKKENAENS